MPSSRRGPKNPKAGTAPAGGKRRVPPVIAPPARKILRDLERELLELGLTLEDLDFIGDSAMWMDIIAQLGSPSPALPPQDADEGRRERKETLRRSSDKEAASQGMPPGGEQPVPADSRDGSNGKISVSALIRMLKRSVEGH